MIARAPRGAGSLRRGRRLPWASGSSIAASITILLLVTLCCSDSENPSTGLDPAGPKNWEIPNPDLSGMEPRVAAQFQAAREAVEKRPGAAARWARFGAVADIHTLFDVAEICYRNAHRLNPDDFQWPYLLAIVREAQGAPAGEVVSWFREAATRNPSYVPLHVRTGKVLTKQGRLDEAREAYLKAIELDAEFAVAYRGLGQVLLGLGEPERAVTRLERAAELEPNDALTLAALSQGYHRLGDEQRAEDALARSSRSDKVELSDPTRGRVASLARSSTLGWRRANQLIEMEKFERAIEILESFVEVYPEDPYGQLRLAYCYLRIGQGDTARAHFTNAIRVKEAWEASVLKTNALPIAKRDLDRVIWRARCDRVTFMAESGQRQPLRQELAEFERAADGVELDYEWEMCWANALMNLEQAERAVDHYRKAAQLVADTSAPHRSLGNALERLGRIDEAIEAYQQAARINPNSPAVESLARLTAAER